MASVTESMLTLSFAPSACPDTGDRIAIASSSFYATDVDEATITSITTTPSGNTLLSIDPPLSFTHLGEVVQVAGDMRGHKLDMRAEVTVLNR